MAAGACWKPACQVVGLHLRTVQRWRRRPGADRRRGPHKAPPNKLSPVEHRLLVAEMTSPGHCDLSPHHIVVRLADQGRFLASESTMYRALRQEKLLAHRHRSRPPQRRRRPDPHRATGPAQVLSWDITYLRSPIRGAFYYLYLALDVWSRKIMAWAVHDCESTQHATEMFLGLCLEHGLDPKGLVFHADNGGPMKGATLLATLQGLGVVTSFSRPRISNDNPFSESLFKTLKYQPNYPEAPFLSIDHARSWVQNFALWYNTQHLHSNIHYVTPDDRHYGRHIRILEQRHATYQRARERNPQRWSQDTRNWKPALVVELNPIPVIPDQVREATT